MISKKSVTLAASSGSMLSVLDFISNTISAAQSLKTTIKMSLSSPSETWPEQLMRLNGSTKDCQTPSLSVEHQQTREMLLEYLHRLIQRQDVLEQWPIQSSSKRITVTLMLKNLESLRRSLRRRPE